MRENVMHEGGTLPPGWAWTTLGEVAEVALGVELLQELSTILYWRYCMDNDN